MQDYEAEGLDKASRPRIDITLGRTGRQVCVA